MFEYKVCNLLSLLEEDVKLKIVKNNKELYKGTIKKLNTKDYNKIIEFGWDNIQQIDIKSNHIIIKM